MSGRYIPVSGLAVFGPACRWTVMLAVALLLAVPAAAADPQIKYVKVEGRFERVSAEQLKARVATVAERGYFAIDLDQVRMAVEDLAWVRAAEVSREWPETLRVVVDEFTPVAHWNATQMVDQSGVVFDAALDEPIRGLPLLSGPEGTLSVVWEQFLRINEQLKPVGEELAALAVDRRGAWEAELVGGTRLTLGAGDLDAKLKRYIAAHEALGPAVVAVDFRYPNGIAVRQAAEENTDGS